MGEESESEFSAGIFGGAPVSVDELVRIHKMTLRLSIAFGVLALAALSPFGFVEYAIGICVGLATGVWNLRALEGSLTRIEPDDYKAGRKRFAMGRMGRLGIITAVALIFLIAVRNVGLGMVFGVGVFYAIMLGNMIVSLARARRENMGHGGAPS